MPLPLLLKICVFLALMFVNIWGAYRQSATILYKMFLKIHLIHLKCKIRWKPFGILGTRERQTNKYLIVQQKEIIEWCRGITSLCSLWYYSVDLVRIRYVQLAPLHEFIKVITFVEGTAQPRLPCWGVRLVEAFFVFPLEQGPSL